MAEAQERIQSRYKMTAAGSPDEMMIAGASPAPSCFSLNSPLPTFHAEGPAYDAHGCGYRARLCGLLFSFYDLVE